ncbi:MAG: pantoate--beta-alanine ligase [Elusimicrobia bacterium]|nr:pantoate--beta-alanine ligase [Elusimicrobiota bacterium]
MIVLRSPEKTFRKCVKEKRKGRIVGLVPTMGALHEGHISLIRKCGKICDFLVVSIFVNPTQFGPSEDFKSYPRDFKRDRKICEENGVDLVFYPTAENVYPPGFETFVNLEKLPSHLCGLRRPGHFRGVATVVLKLFNIIQPDVAVFGKKDYQQFRIIKKMVRDLNIPVRIIGAETVRTHKGLAVSSRNWYLSEDEIGRAAFLRKALLLGKKLLLKGESPARAKQEMRKMLFRTGGKIDYISVCDRFTLDEIKRFEKECLIALAVKIGKARLIDNIEVRRKL